MARRSVNARDVAELAGVSRASVSRCFTQGASISPDTRARILEAADRLGYQVNRLASGLIRSETGLVALIAAEIDTPYRANLLAELDFLQFADDPGGHHKRDQKRRDRRIDNPEALVPKDVQE